MHQKVILVDEMIAGVGTVNLDNRSFFLNFEVMGFVAASRFVKTVDQMLQLDLDNSCLVELKDYERRSLGFKLAVRTSRLLSPIL
jgi:cardiolipin synthase